MSWDSRIERSGAEERRRDVFVVCTWIARLLRVCFFWWVSYTLQTFEFCIPLVPSSEGGFAIPQFLCICSIWPMARNSDYKHCDAYLNNSSFLEEFLAMATWSITRHSQNMFLGLISTKCTWLCESIFWFFLSSAKGPFSLEIGPEFTLH